jgi:hypothetical protein
MLQAKTLTEESSTMKDVKTPLRVCERIQEEAENRFCAEKKSKRWQKVWQVVKS